MYPAQDIIDRLRAETPYSIEFAKFKQPTAKDLVSLPKIYVGYFDLNSLNPSTPKSLDIYDQYGEDLVQGFDVQIHCEIQQLHTIWRVIHKALIGYNSRPGEEEFAGFTYSQGGMIGLENGTAWWVDRWQISFPTVNVFNIGN